MSNSSDSETGGETSSGGIGEIRGLVSLVICFVAAAVLLSICLYYRTCRACRFLRTVHNDNRSARVSAKVTEEKQRNIHVIGDSDEEDGDRQSFHSIELNKA